MKLFFTFLALTAAPLTAQDSSSVELSQLKAGDSIPSVQAVTIEGKPFNLAKDLKGQVVLIDFWATWCGPCVAETPNIVESYKKWKSKGLQVVTISLDKDPAIARSYLAKKKVDWINIADGLGFKSPLAKSFNIKGIPQIVLIGRDGKVYANGLRGDIMKAAIDQAMLGTGIATSERSSLAGLSIANQALFKNLEDALADGTVEQSLASLKPVLAIQPRPYKQLEELCVRYGWKPNTKFHPQTIYLIADAYYNTGITTHKDCRTVGAQRAHAALELGGPHLVNHAITSIKRLNPANTPPEVTALLVHLAIKTGNTKPAVDAIYSEILKGKFTYSKVVSSLSPLKDNGSQNRAILNQWLEQQESQPSDRVSITKNDSTFEVRYQPNQTVFKGSLKINAMIKHGSGTAVLQPMLFNKEKGWHITLAAPAEGSQTRIHFIDNSARTDDNAGKFWLLK